MKIFIFFFALLISAKIYSNDKVIDCKHYVSTTPLSMLEKNISSCGFQKGLADFKSINEKHQQFVYQSLAKELAKKIIQSSEESALLTTFFSDNGDDLLMGSSEVKDQCRVAHIKKIQNCGGNKTGPFFEMKLKALKDNLLGGDSANSKDDLHTILINKYISNLGISKQKGNELQCPIQGSSGSFILQSQLDEISANEIIESLSKTETNFNDKIDKYGQLRLLDRAGLIEKFKDYLRRKPQNISAQKYISEFFKDKTNQKNALGPAMAKQCSDNNDQLNKYLCSDLKEFGSTDSEVSKKMFNGLEIAPMDEQYAVDFTDEHVLAAYGLQCLAAEKKKAVSSPLEKKEKIESIDDWYKAFSNNTRPTDVAGSDKEIIKNFCDKYLCKSNDVKSSPSCKNGGPITSDDLSKLLECPSGKSCDSFALKSIDYIASLKKMQISAGLSLGDSSVPQSPDEIKKTKGILADFAENYLGVEGTLIALGAPVTPILIAEKTADFKERNLNADPPPYQAPITNRTEYASNDKVDSESNPVQNTAYLPGTPTGAAPFAPKSYPQESNSKRIEGIHGKNKNKIADTEHWTDDIPDVVQKKNIDTAQKSESPKSDKPENAVSDNSAFSKDQFEDYKRSVENELRANRNKISSVSSELARTQQELFNQRAEMERRLSDLERKQKETKESSDPKVIAESKALKNEANTLKNEISKLNREPASAASGGGIIVTTEYLKTLNEEELQKRGVNVDEAFVISIKIKDKAGKGDQLVNIPVIRHSSNGKSYLIPRYEGKNEEIIKAIEKSPLFYDFIKVVKAKVKSFASLRELIKGQ